MSATETERDAVVVLRFRRASNEVTLKAELRRASKQQRVIARAIPYQRYDYTVDEYAAHDTARQKITRRLVGAVKGRSSSTHESPSYEVDGVGVDCAMAHVEQMAGRNCGKPKKKAPHAKKKKRKSNGKHQQADSTVDEVRPTAQQSERNRIDSFLNRRLDDERLKMDWRSAELTAVHKEEKPNDSPPKCSLSTTEATMDCCDDADPKPHQGTNVNDDAPIDRVSTAEAIHDSCDGYASKPRRRTTVDKTDAIPGVSGPDPDIHSASGATRDTHKELYDADGARGMISTSELDFDRHILFERTWGPGSCDAKEMVPAPISQKPHGNTGLASCGRKITAKIKRLLHITGKDPVGRPRKEIKRTIKAWSDSVIEPWELTQREDLNWDVPYDQWVDEWGVDIKTTVIPGSLAGKARTDKVSSGHVPNLSDFRTKEELWQYLHPANVGNVPRDLKSMYGDGKSCSAPSSNATSEDPAELPAYEEVMSADARPSLGTAESPKGKSKAVASCSTSFPPTASIRPEDLWLYTPRSCSTCGDFGLLPLHYCVECRKLRIDMCSECYGMGHDSCQRDGHEVAERHRIQQFSPSANSASASLPIRAAAEQGPQKAHRPQNMEQLLTFLTEERSFMRGEIERARSEKAGANMLAAGDAAEATVFRIAKLRLLPTLITDGKVGGLKKQKSSISIKDFAPTHSGSVNDDERQPAGKDVTPSKEPEEASTETNTLKKPSSQPIHAESVASSRVPKWTFPEADALQPRDSDRELVDMDTRLRKQEQLQGFRERELCLREKEYSLRERELVLDLKERQLLEPGFVPTDILASASAAYTTPSTMSTSTGPANYATTQTEMPRHVPDATVTYQKFSVTTEL